MFKRSLVITFFGIGLISGLIWFLINKEKKINMTIFNVAVDLDHLSNEIDPIHIPTLSDAFYINHLYSNLVQFDEQKNLKVDLAKDFYWLSESELVFEFEVNSPVTAEDAAFNFRRIMYYSKNLHGDLTELICDPNESTADCIKRVSIVDGKLLINIHNLKSKNFLLNTLASIDYKIVPLKAFSSQDYRTAKIIDFTKTSGHYYLQERTRLVRNSFAHLKFSNNIKEFQLINSNYNCVLEQARNNKINIISTTVPIKQEDFLGLIEHGFEIFESHPISVYMLVFSPLAITDFSIEERFQAGSIITKEIAGSVSIGSSETIQFIQNFGQGYLNESQFSIISEQRNKNKGFNGKPKRKFKLGVRNIERWKKFIELNPQFELQKITGSVLNMTDDTKPDIYALTNDVSFETDYGLLAFAVKNKFLKLDNLSQKNVMQKFMDLKTDSERIKFINEVHYYSIKNALIFPMFSSPYTTATLSNLAPGQSKYNSRTLLWLIK